VLRQLEDEKRGDVFQYWFMGAGIRRRFTTQGFGDRCADYMLIARRPDPTEASKSGKLALLRGS